MLETDDITGRALSTQEWSQVAGVLMMQHKQPCDIVKCTTSELVEMGISPLLADRLYRLAQRSIPLGFKINQLHGQGIHLITRADATYPQIFKNKLNQKCPPLFYGLGNFDLLNHAQMAVGVVGSRSIAQDDQNYVSYVVGRFVEQGYTIVSGGARGVDITAIEQALSQGGNVIIYTADRLDKQLNNTLYAKAIYNGNLVILSAHKPDLGFRTAIAMMRNHFIYVQSYATLVVKSDANKGGTWSGAIDNLKHAYAYTLCRNIPFQGNKLLIEQGAIPVDNTWDCNVLSLTQDKLLQPTVKFITKSTQKSDELSLFSGVSFKEQAPSIPSDPAPIEGSQDQLLMSKIPAVGELSFSQPSLVVQSSNISNAQACVLKEERDANVVAPNVSSNANSLDAFYGQGKLSEQDNKSLAQTQDSYQVGQNEVETFDKPIVTVTENPVTPDTQTQKSDSLAQSKIKATENSVVSESSSRLTSNSKESLTPENDNQLSSNILESSVETKAQTKRTHKKDATSTISQSNSTNTPKTKNTTKTTKPRAKSTRAKKTKQSEVMPLLDGLSL